MARLSLLLLLLSPLPLTAQVIHEVTPLELGVNVEDYAPVPVDAGFIMCSLRESGGAIDVKDARTGKPFSDIYFVPLNEQTPGRPVLFSGNITTPVNEGPAAFSKGGNEICYTRNIQLPKKLSNFKGTNGQLGLFLSQKISDVWQMPIPFEHNSPKYALMHPTYDPEGGRLYFASDMPGGFGGLDVYSSRRTAQGWTEPENLGATVNGPGNEAFPRMQADGKLHFSSDRSGGLGQLDVYWCEKNGEGWTSPIAFPAPINSPANDVGYTLFADGFNGIMSSDRNGADRIFMVKRTVERFRDCTEQRTDNFCYAFKGRKHAATANLPLEHMWDMGDGHRLKGHTVNHCYEEPGTYEVRSLLVDKQSGAIFHVINNNELVVERTEQAYITTPDTVRTGRQLALDPEKSHTPGMTAAEYHWDLGDGNRRRTPRVIHQYKTPGVYEVKLDIIGTPDAQGNIANRCNTRKIVVMDRYREHEDQTVVAVYQDAFGNTRQFEFQELPFDDLGLAFAENADVTFSVTLFASKERVSLDDARFIEVRKHYRVIERYDPEKGVYTYSVGETKNLEELYAVYKKVKELQFLDAEVFALEVEKLVGLSQLDLASLKELNHSKLRTSAIHFGSSSAELGEDSEEVLLRILGLLRQHPQLHLVIEAHTDDVGSVKDNLDLSQLRAASVVAYLVDQGVDTQRLVPIGHGENQPIASNKSETGRSKNRRVEFRMVVKEELPSLVDMKQ